jgi:hypothetical protein
VKMIKAVREGRDSCSDLSWVFKLDRIGPRMSGVAVVGSTGGSWVAVVVVVGDDDCACMRLSGVTFDVTPTVKRIKNWQKIARKKKTYNLMYLTRP